MVMSLLLFEAGRELEARVTGYYRP
jgi:hypothetical protein